MTTETANINVPAVASYNPGAIAEYGNQVLLNLIQSVAFDDAVAELTAKANETKQHIGFELTKAILDLHEKHDDLNIYAVFEGGKAVEKLNTRVLIHFGVLKREIVGDEIVTSWTDEAVQNLYDYSAKLKEENEAEWKKRFDNRKRLNIRLSDAYKAAITLIDNGNKADDLVLEQNDAGIVNPIIKNAPKEIAGEKAEPVKFGQRTVNVGATHSATQASLVKIATDRHKKANGERTEKSDKGNDKSGEAKLGMSDETFGGMVNNLKRAISAQEGKFTPEMLKQMKSLHATLGSIVAPKS